MPVRRWARAAVGAVLAALLLAPLAPAAETRPITDSAGRRVEMPARIDRVYAAGGPASIILYTLAPEKMVGWTRALTAEERAFVPARFATLPTFGRLTGRGNTANVEVVLAARPDIVLDYGAITPTYVSLADRVQQQIGVPYLLFDGSLSAIPAAYEAIGKVLGVPDRGRDLARHAERLLKETDAQVARVPADRRPSVYYARGPRGLETASKGSINVESLERLGARNVAVGQLERGGVVAVSVEQVLAWNPDVIVTIEPAFATAVRSDPLWRDVKAVREGRVYLVPRDPFPWVDFPPSVNRLIGLRWLGRVLYPDVFSSGLRQEARAFYTAFYHQAPSDRQLDALIGSLEPSRP